MPDSFKNCLAFLHGRFRSIATTINRAIQYKRSTSRSKRLSSSSFDKLTSTCAPKEVSGQFRLVFKLIDANGDGKISACELGEVLSCLGYDKSKAAREAEGMVREIDCNGDGFVDLDEFIGAVNYCNDDDYDLMNAFSVFDSDRNGLISAGELQRVLTSLGCDDCSLQQCKRMIKGVDKDGDGFVDFDEFRSMMKVN